MKFAIVTLLVALFAFSCQEDLIPMNHFPQTWKIVGWQSIGFSGDSGFQPISDSTYTYLFKKDGTFIKAIGSESTTGTYQIGEKRIQYDLKFIDDRLVHSCFGNTEKLSINENKMLVGGSAPCDGAALFFSLERGLSL